MNTRKDNRTKEGKQISLNPAERRRLENTNSTEEIEIEVKRGVIRIAGKLSNRAEELTLAFASRADVFKFQYPADLEITIEAITDASFLIESRSKTDFKTRDAIADWIIQLHIVRCEANSERRVMRLFELMTMRLGKRTSKGLILEHTLSHARIAEIVGSTRSTVSRTISSLRRNRKIYIDELKNQIILPVD